MTQNNSGLRLVLLGFVAVIAIAGLVVLFTQNTKITGNAALRGYDVYTRTPYEACRALRTGNDLVPDATMVVNPKTTLIKCVDPWDPDNTQKAHYVELQYKRG
jgi:hypothetical protein